MTTGTSQGLFIIVAVVIFGIFVAISYLLFSNIMKPKLASIFCDSFTQVGEQTGFVQGTCGGNIGWGENDNIPQGNNVRVFSHFRKYNASALGATRELIINEYLTASGAGDPFSYAGGYIASKQDLNLTDVSVDNYFGSPKPIYQLYNKS